MKFACQLKHLADGRWHARHQGESLGVVEARGTTREEVLEKLRNELRYRLELCPCSGESYQHIDVQVIEDSQ